MLLAIAYHYPIYEAEVKSSSSTSHNTQNIAFVSSHNTDITNELVSVVPSVSAASTKASVSTLLNVDNLSDDAIYSFFASQSNSPQLDNKDWKQIDADDLEEMDLKCQMAMLTMRARRSPRDTRKKDTQRRTVPVETSTSNALVSQCDGVGSYDWSFQADEEPTNYALMAFTSSSSSSSSGYDNQVFNSQVFDCDELNSSESDDSVPISPVNDRYKIGEGYHAVPPPYNGTFMPRKPDLVFNDAISASEPVPTMTSDSKDEFEPESMSNQKETSFVPPHEHVKTPRAFVKTVKHLTKAENLKEDIPKSRGHKHSWTRKACFVCKSLNHLIKDCDFYEKQMVQKLMWNHAMRVNHHNSARITHPHSNRHIVPTTVLTRSRLVPLNAARPVTTVVPQPIVKSPKPVKHVVTKAHSLIKRPINHGPTPKNSNFHQKVTTVKAKKVNAVQGTKGNWVWKPKCIVLDHTNTECVVLSSDFKLLDVNHVLLRVPRENNMYNVNLNNVVPSGDLTCLFAKATLDESNLWHRRLGHINFKIMNKLVKGNLIRGLPSKVFENNHTCVACKKGKQHRASWNQPNPSAGIQENLVADADAAFDVKENENEVHVSPSSRNQPKKHDEKAKREAKGQSPVDLSTGVRDLSDEFEEFSVNSTNKVNAASAPITDVGPNPTNNTISFNDVSPSDNAINEEGDVGAAADFSNLKTNISVSPIPTTIVYKDHPVTQIIGDLTAAPPTRSMARMVKEQAPKAWYETLANYLLENGFQRGKIDQTLFIKKQKGDILLVQVYVDDIIFGSTNKELCKASEKLIKDKFQMSLMGELTFFGITTSTSIDTEKPLLKDPDGGDVDVHIYRYLKGKPPLGLWYPKDSPFKLVAYSDSDYAGASLNKKSTTGGCQFLGCRLISWQCKKQTVVATSSTEAEYVAAASCYAQVSIAGTTSTEQPSLKDKSMWSDQEKRVQKIDRLARSLLIQGLSNDIYSLMDSNKTAKDLWDALARHMLGSKYGEQERKAANKNLMDINIDALYNILKQNQGDVNDAVGSKKKTVVVTSDPLALIAEKTNVSRSKEKVIVSSDSEGSEADDFSEKFYSKPTNNNLRTSSSSQSANKKQEFVKTDNKRVKKKDDEKKRDMSRVKCYNCKKKGHFAKDCKKVKVKDYEYYKTKMLLPKKDKDEQVLLAEDQAWMESSSDSDQE
nr:putative ribonuclease H-like domain-containing protein [Tanacetum cinerariifolium]